MSERATAIAVVVLCALLSACGFRLAGARTLPLELQSVYIETRQPYSVDESLVETAMRSQLRRRGSVVVDQPSAARSVVRLSDFSERRDVLSVGTDGKALEFQLVTTVTFSLWQQGNMVLPPQQQTVSRDYSFNAEEVLAKEAEEERLREFMQGELAELILLRLETALLRRPRAPAPAG